MKKWLKRIRGAVGVGLTWAVVWGLVGPLLLSLVTGVVTGGQQFAIPLLMSVQWWVRALGTGPCTLLCTFGFPNPEEDCEIIPGNEGQKPPTYSDSVETAALWRVC